MFGIFKNPTGEAPLTTKATICSFCGKSHDEVRKIIAGPDGVYICDACVTVCNGLIGRELRTESQPEPRANPKMVKLQGGIYNMDNFVALTEEKVAPTPKSDWVKEKSQHELVVQFCGGVSVRLPISERGRIEKLIRGEIESEKPKTNPKKKTEKESN